MEGVQIQGSLGWQVFHVSPWGSALTSGVFVTPGCAGQEWFGSRQCWKRAVSAFGTGLELSAAGVAEQAQIDGAPPEVVGQC